MERKGLVVHFSASKNAQVVETAKNKPSKIACIFFLTPSFVYMFVKI